MLRSPKDGNSLGPTDSNSSHTYSHALNFPTSMTERLHPTLILAILSLTALYRCPGFSQSLLVTPVVSFGDLIHGSIPRSCRTSPRRIRTARSWRRATSSLPAANLLLRSYCIIYPKPELPLLGYVGTKGCGQVYSGFWIPS